MSKKKKALIIAALTLAFIVAVFIVSNIIMVLGIVFPNYKYDKPEAVSKNDTYTIIEEYKYDDDDEISYIKVYVKDNKSGKIVFTAAPARARDYNGTEFVEGTSDFTLYSGDVGDFYYKYDSEKNTWTETNHDEIINYEPEISDEEKKKDIEKAEKAKEKKKLINTRD
ncbi:MAG: hypothetical protein IJT65_04960 [Eubacterium sp.]|nr:hypothetical protein [Eubacterium sp.]